MGEGGAGRRGGIEPLERVREDVGRQSPRRMREGGDVFGERDDPEAGDERQGLDARSDEERAEGSAEERDAQGIGDGGEDGRGERRGTRIPSTPDDRVELRRDETRVEVHEAREEIRIDRAIAERDAELGEAAWIPEVRQRLRCFAAYVGDRIHQAFGEAIAEIVRAEQDERTDRGLAHERVLVGESLEERLASGPVAERPEGFGRVEPEIRFRGPEEGPQVEPRLLRSDAGDRDRRGLSERRDRLTGLPYERRQARVVTDMAERLERGRADGRHGVVEERDQRRASAIPLAFFGCVREGARRLEPELGLRRADVDEGHVEAGCEPGEEHRRHDARPSAIRRGRARDRARNAPGRPGSWHPPGRMKTFVDALRTSGLSESEVNHVTTFPGGLVALWQECGDPVLMLRLAGIVGADPKSSVAIAIEGATAVLPYVGATDPRPAKAIAAAKDWLRGRVSAKECEVASHFAEAVGVAFREARPKSAADRRAYRAASHAALAAAKAAQVARDAALTTELDYDATYTFEDAWDGARVSCANGAAQALIDSIEASLAAISANTTIETGTPIAGVAAADENRLGARTWAASIVRSHLTADTLRLGSIRL